MFVNAKTGKNFEASDNRRVNFLRHADNFMKHSVNAKPNKYRVIQNLHMHIGRAGRKRIGEKVINNSDNGKVFRGLLQASSKFYPQRFANTLLNHLLKVLRKFFLIQRKSPIQTLIGREERLRRTPKF